MNTRLTLIVLLTLAPAARPADVPKAKPVGAQGPVGCKENPTKADRLVITKPGVYENYLIDGNGQTGNRVKISADDVTLRNCEIFNCAGNGVGVFAKNVVIENCKIHHLLAGTYKEQHDAHGITGRWGNVTIRNCEIFYVSGDAVQFDPDRQSRGQVTVEDCTFWTGPLPEDAGKFEKGERPGENGIDTKTMPGGEPALLTVRNCYFHGYNQPAQLGNAAALNLKENVRATVEHCVFRDNEIALRLRGPGKRGGATVSIKDCAVYEGKVGVRMEDKVRDLKIDGLAFGPKVERKYREAGGGPGPGYDNKNEREAPPPDELLKKGFPRTK